MFLNKRELVIWLILAILSVGIVVGYDLYHTSQTQIENQNDHQEEKTTSVIYDTTGTETTTEVIAATTEIETTMEVIAATTEIEATTEALITATERELTTEATVTTSEIEMATEETTSAYPNAGTEETTSGGTPESTSVTIRFEDTSSTVWEREGYNKSYYEPDDTKGQKKGHGTAGLIIMIISGIGALICSVILRQKQAFFGPDGALVLGTVIIYILCVIQFDEMTFMEKVLCIYILMLSTRELFGWVRRGLKMPDMWVSRMSREHFGVAVFLYTAGFVLAAAGITVFCIRYSGWAPFIPVTVFLLLHSISCIRLSRDLKHFSAQILAASKEGEVEVREGLFSTAEQMLRELQESQREAIREAVANERFKVELISNVSHDLRTPLTSILGYAELLERERLSEEGRGQLTQLNLKAGYMSDLVESLFELTKVSSGVVEAKKESINLIGLIEQTIGLLQDELDRSGLAVRRNYPGDMCMIVSDGDRLHQVFTNLLGNAIKYALPQTRLYITVSLNDDEVTVRMTNTSSYEMDFTPEEIMQRFARGDKARTTKGSGLGLTIAKTYTESVGGRFEVGIDGDQYSATVHLERNL
ncbi:MAG: hypothetical protein IJJ74_10690 [Eubacterium sp.]|nr:hypothetical protein [Eubacterium sp.]